MALVAIGGATRVMEAGLACPDWPLCYGSLLPGQRMNLQVFLEWFHRLDAFLAGIGLIGLLAFSLLRRALLPAWLPLGAALALILVAVQGMLGALTVTRLLEASTVTAHLTTALLLVLLLSALHQGIELLVDETPQRPAAAAALSSVGSSTSLAPLPTSGRPAAAAAVLPAWWFGLTLLAATALLAQCVLGGSMASRWAADTCLASGDGCRWLWLHRLGAWPALVLLALQASASLVLPAARGWLRALAGSAALLVAVQVALGVLTLRLQLQVPLVTVAHQLCAALMVGLCGAVIGRSLAASPFSSSQELVHG